MKHLILNTVCAIALACAGIPGARVQPAYAQEDISFDSMHDALSGYGDWLYSDRWGEVWAPDVPDDFQPYGTEGHWAMTDDYGWTWVSDYPWGDIPFHYGRWVLDPDDGWLWIPGYVWSPAWVVWRSNGEVTGWMPMPPDPAFLNGEADVRGDRISVAINFNDSSDFYGYRRWYGPAFDETRFAGLWVFVGTAHFADRDFRHYERPRAEIINTVRNTTNITNYTVVNNVVVNKSVDVHMVERASGHPISPVAANQVMHRANLITNVDQGRHAQEAMRNVTPRGNGATGSAPQPTAAVVSGLSTKAPAHRGGSAAPAHLFTKQTVQQAPLANRRAEPTPAAQTQEQKPQDQRGPQQRGPEPHPSPSANPQQDHPQQSQERPAQQSRPDQRQEPAAQQQQQREDQARQTQPREEQQRQQPDQQKREDQARQTQQREEQQRQQQDQQKREDQARQAQQREEQQRQRPDQQKREDQARQTQQREEQQRQQQDQQKREDQARQAQQREEQQRQQQQEHEAQQRQSQAQHQEQMRQEQRRPPQAEPHPQQQQDRHPPPKAGDKKDERQE